MDHEEVISGGVNVVRRVGDTVILPAGVHTEAVHALLRHVRERGFAGAPEALGHDPSAEEETVSFLPGTVTGFPVRPEFRTERAMLSMARLLRDLHDASLGFDLERDDWGMPARQPTEVICHGDPATYNAVVVDGEVAGLFDFDTAHPGPRVWDVAFAAYHWVPLGPPGEPDRPFGVEEQARRLEMFCLEYGVADIGAVVMTVGERLLGLTEHITAQAAAGHPAFTRHLEEGHVDHYDRDREWIDAHRAELVAPG